MHKRMFLVLGSAFLFVAGYSTGNQTMGGYAAGNKSGEHAPPTHGSVPKSYGRLVAAIADNIGTGLVFEDSEGTIRFVSMTGMKEGELVRYDKTPTHGGLPKSYGHLVTAVVNSEGTGLVFEDSQGLVRLVSIAGQPEGELTRN